MPCDSSHLEHTAREAESGRVLELLKEVDGKRFNHKKPSYYGTPDTLDADTARLCAWCRAHEARIPSMSLELQIWWRDHKDIDARRGR